MTTNAPVSFRLHVIQGAALIFGILSGTNQTAWATDIPSPASVNAEGFPQLLFNQTGDGMGISPYQWSLNGSSGSFYLTDETSGGSPFVVESGGPPSSFVLNSQGFVGINLAEATFGVPHRLLHVGSGEAAVIPTLRLQHAVANPLGKVWDIEGSTQSFRIVDGDTGFAPFKLMIDAPSNCLVIDSSGSIGLGTTSPNQIGAATSNGRWLNVRANGATIDTGVASIVAQGNLGSHMHLVHNNGPANQRIIRFQCSSGLASFHVLNDSLTTYAVPNVFNIKMSNGNIGLRVLSPLHPLHLASGAHVTAGGVFTNASSRELKEKIRPLTSEQARDAIRAMQPVEYNYKNEPGEGYVGFIAEDVPELVATKDRKSLAPMDVVAVLTKVVQDQDQQNERLRATVEQERLRNDCLEATLASVTKRLAELERKSERGE